MLLQFDFWRRAYVFNFIEPKLNVSAPTMVSGDSMPLSIQINIARLNELKHPDTYVGSLPIVDRDGGSKKGPFEKCDLCTEKKH